MKYVYILRTFVFTWSLILVNIATAQPGCPSVNAGSNQTLPCGVTCTNLTATYFNTGNTNSYAVSTIPYTPFSYTAGTSILVNQDDIWSSAINLPFTFCFFGNAYNQLTVGANGLVSFNVAATAGQYCQWNTTTGGTFPTNGMYTNVIMGAYHDIDPTLGGTIKYQIIGSAPCRIFVVSWNNVPMYDDVFLIGSCWNVPKATHQIAIYETTNVVEVYIQNKNSCSGWNNGLASVGIQNDAGTVAYMAPGWNNSVWNASNQGRRFTPNGTSIVNLEWLQAGNVIGTGATINVCPTAATTYTAQATYTPCNGGTPVVVTSNVTVTPNSTFQAAIDSSRNVSCNGANNGAAYAHVTGGLPPVNYGWNTAPNQTTITGLAPATYTFTASDGSGCTITNSVTITQPPALTTNVPSVTQTNCSGTGTGTLTATASGGTPPYTFAWSSSAQTDSILDNVSAGSYTLTVTDANNCTATATGTLTIQVGGNTVSLNPPAITNVSCNGGNNGSITASATGGSGTFTYSWSNAQSGATISSLAQGSYTVSVNDGAGCTVSATYNVTQPTALTLNAPNITNIGCSGATSGSITANPTGGTPAYTYSWTKVSNGQSLSGQTISNLQPDTYTLTVTDLNSCSVTATHQITSTPPLTFTQSQINVSCNGGNDGSATITITSGQVPIQYNWNGAGNTSTNPLTGISAGSVNVTVTDANQCTGTATFTITQPSAVQITTPQLTPVSCFGGNDGAITVSTSGGTGTITANWSNGQNNTTTISALAANTYTVTATDQNNCSTTASYTITEPAALVITAPNITNIGCGGGTGSITVNHTGGTANYNYNWLRPSDNQTFTGKTITGLTADNYDVTVTDGNGCSTSATYTITQPLAIVFTQQQTDVTCFGGSDGTAQINVTSGTLPYSYNWNGTGNSPNNVLSNIGAGIVNVIVSDANCSATATFTIAQPSAVAVNLVSLSDVTCNGANDGSIQVNASGGTPNNSAPAYQFLWNTNPPQNTSAANNLGQGTYTVVATDMNGCTGTQTYNITEPAPMNTTLTATDATCYGATNGSAEAIVQGGNPPYSYLWSDPNAQTTAKATALAASLYLVVVTDANGCTSGGSVLLNEPTELMITTSATAVKCPGDENGTITVNATGATAPYNYSVTLDFANFIFTTNGVAEGLKVGMYNVVVSDNNGCTKVVQEYVPDALPDNFTAYTDSTSCYGPNYADGSAHIISTSMTNGPYLYSIDGGGQQYSGDFYFLSAGAHTITAVSNFGCVSEIPVVVLQPLPIIVDVIPDTVVLALGETQQVQTVFLNAGNVTYNWENTLGLSCTDCPNPFVTAYQTGNHVVVVSEQNGSSTCYGSATLHVSVLPQQPVFVPNAFSPNGDGNNDVFMIFGEGISTVNLTIFNRWGELVFESNNQYDGWDGTYKGVLQNPSVFTYNAQITYLNGKKTEKKGTVTLMR